MTLRTSWFSLHILWEGLIEDWVSNVSMSTTVWKHPQSVGLLVHGVQWVTAQPRGASICAWGVTTLSCTPKDSLARRWKCGSLGWIETKNIIQGKSEIGNFWAVEISTEAKRDGFQGSALLLASCDVNSRLRSQDQERACVTLTKGGKHAGLVLAKWKVESLAKNNWSPCEIFQFFYWLKAIIP